MARKKKSVKKLEMEEVYEPIQPVDDNVTITDEYYGPFTLTVNLQTTYFSENVPASAIVCKESVLVSADPLSGMPSGDIEYDYSLIHFPSEEEGFDPDKWGKWDFVEWVIPQGGERITIHPSDIIIPSAASGEIPEAVVNKEITVTADWQTSVKLRFFAKCESEDLGNYETVYVTGGQTYNGNIEVPCDFSFDDYQFKGWGEHIEPSGGISWVAGTDRTIVSININQNSEYDIIGSFEKRIDTTGWNQKIVFHINYGSVDTSATQDVYVGTPVQLITNQFERPKHDFMGWATNPVGEVRYGNNDMYNASKYTEIESIEEQKVKQLDLYAVWKKQAQYLISDDDICITGYDPFPVVFRDMSRIRSFKNTYWQYDFGDSIIYGYDTSNITGYNSSCGLDISTSAAAFILPGDEYVYNHASQLFKDEIEKPIVESGVMMCPDWSSYHCNLNASVHYTGVKFRAVTSYDENHHDSDQFGAGCYPVPPTDYVANDELKRIWYWPNTKESTDNCSGYIRPVEVSGVHQLMNEDDCGRNACERENDLKNSVMHIYKGAGIYYTTMQVSSKTGLQSMEVSQETFSNEVPASDKEVVSDCYVKVLPTCPCISGFHVYGTNGGGAHYDRTFDIIKDPYSCDGGIFNTTQSKFNCVIEFTDINGNVKKTKAISGYAPYLKVCASGSITPRSIPIKGAYIDWGDWFSDYHTGDYVEYGDPVKGWPNWETKLAGSALNISGSHVYVMPGLYSIGIAPDFNTAWIKKYMPTVTDYEDCMDTIMADSASGCCVLVVENPPKFDESTPITTGSVANPGKHPTIVSGMTANVIAGSYPISRIDWDFGDGTKILSISTEGYKIDPNTKDVIGNKSGSAVLVDYNTDCTSASPIKSANITYGTMYGHTHHSEPTLTYNRWDARNYSISHTYTRTNFDDHPNGYVVTVSAYAENTNTCVTASTRVLTDFGSELPHYDVVEGDIELVDTRSDEIEMTNIVLQSDKGSRLYVNRVVDDE